MCGAPKPLIWWTFTLKGCELDYFWDTFRHRSLGGFDFLKITQTCCQKISETKVNKCKSRCVHFCFPLPVIMRYFVLPKSSCIEWEYGNLDTIMIFGNLSMCFGKFSVTKLPKSKITDVIFSILCFMRYFLLPKSSCIVFEIGNSDTTIMIFGNLSMCLGKFSAAKLTKSKIWDVLFSMLSFMRYYLFAISYCICSKNVL